MSLRDMKDDELWEAMRLLSAEERPVIAVVVEHLAEVDRRSLYFDRGFRSLYEYCIYSLKYPEGAAYRRIRAARAVSKRPELARSLRDGTISLETLTILHPHLEAPYYDELLKRVKGLTTREVEMIAAEYQIGVRARDVVRFIGMEARAISAPADASAALPLSLIGGGSDKAEAQPAAAAQCAVAPNDGERPMGRKLVRISFTADEELYELLCRSRQLMRHKYPDGRLEGIFRDSLKLLIEAKDLGVRMAKAAERKTRRHGAKRAQ